MNLALFPGEGSKKEKGSTINGFNKDNKFQTWLADPQQEITLFCRVFFPFFIALYKPTIKKAV